ncbi:MAG: hypothetical protein KC503_32640 [Myxococcales bacterium]|nr:hypothetical protein [Myxococcales bacterium]
MALVAWGCGDETVAPDGGTPADGGGDTQPDAATGPSSFTVRVFELVGAGGQSQSLIFDAMVALDQADGTRLEKLTGSDGRVTFSEVDWSAGPIALTVGKQGYGLVSSVNIDGTYLASVDELPVILTALKSPAHVAITGTATNTDPSATYLTVTSNRAQVSSQRNDLSFGLSVDKGEPFTLIGLQWTEGPKPSGARDFAETLLGWTELAQPAAQESQSVTLDFANALAPETHSGTITLPANTSLVATASRAFVRVSDLSSGLFLGAVTVSSCGATSCTFEAEHVETQAALSPVTSYILLVFDGITSLVRRQGYPKAGASVTVDGFLVEPRLIAPTNTKQAVPLRDRISWECGPDAEGSGLVIGGGIWTVTARAGRNDVTVPLAPTGIDERALLGVGLHSAQVQCIAGNDKAGALRASTSRTFILQL